MRALILCLIAAVACSAEPTQAPPAALTPAAQKALDDAHATAAKAHDAFLQALKKEQDRLLATLQREQERETKKGNLNGALALKAKAEEVQGGLLQRQAESTDDLLGEATAPAKPGLAMVACDSALPISKGEEVAGAPESVAKFINAATCATLAKGDKTRYNLVLLDAGMVVANTGGSERNNGELWRDLMAAGFKRIEGSDNGWYVLEGKAGAKFTAYDPLAAGLPLRLWVKRIEKAR